MIIAIEGCDCAGKSTFAQALSEATGYEIVKGSSFTIAALGMDTMFEYMNNLLDRDNIILDRTFYSNIVYGKLFNYPVMSKEQCTKLHKKLFENGILIYLHADRDVIQDRMSVRGDDYVKIDNVDDILQKYSEVMCSEFAPTVMLSLDTAKIDYKKIISFIKDGL